MNKDLVVVEPVETVKAELLPPEPILASKNIGEWFVIGWDLASSDSDTTVHWQVPSNIFLPKQPRRSRHTS